jgi:hypothetical protein
MHLISSFRDISGYMVELQESFQLRVLVPGCCYTKELAHTAIHERYARHRSKAIYYPGN